MTRRRLLRACVKLAALAGVAAFLVVYARGLLGPGLPDSVLIEFGGMAPGTARMDSWRGRQVWVIHRSDRQLRALEALDAHVRGEGVDPGPIANFHRSLDPRWGVYLAATPRQGVLVRYLSERPPGLPRDLPWHGGFVDPGSRAVFDPAGRPYRATGGSPLAVPPHRLTGRGLELGRW